MIRYFEDVVYKGKSNRLKETFIMNNYPDFYIEIIKYEGNSFLEKLFIFYKGNYKCKCGSNTKFISFTKGYLKFCSYKCSSNDIEVREKYKKTCENNYGVSNVSKCNIVKLKKESTCIERYGVSTYLQTDNTRNIIKEKYGVDNPFKLKVIQENIKKTNLKKYGFECSLLNDGVMAKSTKTNIEKYGVNHFSKSDIFKSSLKLRNFDLYRYVFDFDGYELLEKRGNLNIIRHNKCNNIFEIQSQLVRIKKSNNQEMCPVCNPYNPSYKETEFGNFIESMNLEIIKNYRDIYEIDVYVPELKLGFEFNGLYWHSELFKNSDYHLNKTNYFKEKGIQLIHIWEDDWKFKQSIVKSIILNKLKITPNRIGSRVCDIASVSDREAKDFLNLNHLQGWCVSKYRIALRYKGEIVSICTFGKNRINLGSTPKDGEYELLRFCNKINWSIHGSFSKMLNFFIKNYKVDNLVTYADYSISNGDLYFKAGFNFIKNTLPNYHYIIDGVRKNRFLFTKQNLIKEGHSEFKTEREIMFESKKYRIYDCGSMKFTLKMDMYLY
jgi:hypothetical protein